MIIQVNQQSKKKKKEEKEKMMKGSVCGECVWIGRQFLANEWMNEWKGRFTWCSM